MIDPALDAASDQIRSAETVIPMVQAFFDEATFTASRHEARGNHRQRTGRSRPQSRRIGSSPMLRIMGWGLTGCSKRMSVPIICPLAPGRADRDWTLDQQRVFGTLFQMYADLARDGSAFDWLFEDGDRFGDLKAIVLHVPGHTALDLAYVIGNAAFVGDTIFMPDYGTARADFPGGDPRTLYRSIRRPLTLPEHTLLFLCHDYKAPGRETFAWQTTVVDQRRRNVHVRDGVDVKSFVAMRTARDASLGMPRLILPSIQVNMRAGRLPSPEANGISYLKIPVDALAWGNDDY